MWCFYLNLFNIIFILSINFQHRPIVRLNQSLILITNMNKFISKLILIFIFIVGLLKFNSCCIIKTNDPDLRITGQNFPSSAGVNQRFGLAFTVGNFSTGECEASATNQSSVNLRMVNRETGHVQVNDPLTLNALGNNATQNFAFTVIIGTAGTYDLTFVVDPNNTSGEKDRNNNTYTGVVVIN